MIEVQTLAATFERERPRLVALGYRMLGSRAEAEDVAQEAWLRLGAHGGDGIASLPAWLTRTTGRLALDRLKSARQRRETYVGPWLPEPVPTDPWSEGADGIRAESLSIACLAVLESLSPLERAAWVLMDVFDEPAAAVAEILERDPAAVRQLCHRARKHLETRRPRFDVSRDEHQRLLGAFALAVAQGDLEALRRLLAQDAVVTSDGGGRARAALRPILGLDAAARFLVGISTKWPAERASWVMANGAPAIAYARGPERGVIFLDLGRDAAGRAVIRGVYLVINPEKLVGLLGE